MIRVARMYARRYGLGVLLLGALANSVPVDANQTIASGWTGKYSASASDNAGCLLCHDKAVPDPSNLRWNSYGRALRQALHQQPAPTLNAALDSIKDSNSDADAGGASNLVEIQAGTQPGWRAGNANTIYDANGVVATNQPPPSGVGSLDPPPAAPTPSLSISDVTGNEGDGGTTPFVFTVSLSSASTSTVTVNYATASGTATAGVDFVSTSGTLSIQPGATSGSITVEVKGNTTVEGNRTFSLQLSGSVNATIVDAQGIATIIDDDGESVPGSANFQGLWWNSPPGSEAGWGINVAHQGDAVFASWFTYDLNGRGWWLVMSALPTGPNRFSGNLIEVRGPPFNTVPFPPLNSPGGAIGTIVGLGVLAFTDENNGTFAYTVNGISQTKNITRQVLGTAPLPVCAFSPLNNPAAATNYQDIWWAVPPGSEDGWGINLTHQGATIFASWFTYDGDRAPMWLVVTALQIGPAAYTGDLYRTIGPPFNTVPFPPIGTPGGATATKVGTATFAFSSGQTASFAYTVNGVSQTKTITRQVFRPPGTVCR